MKKYNLSEIMKAANTMRKFNSKKYPTLSEALKAAWRSAKLRVQMKEDQEEVNDWIEAKRVERIRLEEERASTVEAECQAYGYGRGDHYNMFGGWGNYCGD